MSKVKLGAGIVNYPMPVALIGTCGGSRVNFMTCAWLSMASFAPPRIAISLGNHMTRNTIRETGVFSVCFPSKKDATDVLREPGLAARWQSGDLTPSRCVGCGKCYSPQGVVCIFNRKKG
jgi:flavin reductase (DIM6/NTAB) family NADH-FMN oxidoreductase RutF